MSTLIIILAILSFYHFVVENMILPTFKRETQYKIINLRTELLMKYGSDNIVQKKDVILLANIMTYSVNEFEHHNIIEFIIYSIRRERDVNKNAEISKSVEKLATIDGIRDIVFSFNKQVGDIFILNIGAWIIYLVPFIIMSKIIKRVRSIKVASLRNLKSEIRAIYMASEKPNVPLYSSKLSHMHINHNNAYLYERNASDCMI